jgi:hypothetical protein
VNGDNKAEFLKFDFFDRHDEGRAEIVEGLIREGQLVAFAGPFGMGNFPCLLI